MIKTELKIILRHC